MDVRWSRRRDSNPEPAVYKTAALPIELRRRDGQGHTAVDHFRRRGMIRSDGRMGQARGVRLRVAGFPDGSPAEAGLGDARFGVARFVGAPSAEVDAFTLARFPPGFA